MTAGAGESLVAACRQALDALLTGRGTPTAEDRRRLSTLSGAVLDTLLREFADAHGATATDLLTALAAESSDRALRRAAKRALYRLSQRGLVTPASAPSRSVLAGETDRAVRAWLSGIDGSGSRAAWILFEGSFGVLRPCSLILNDT